MKNNDLISVIVPVYNVEKYLKKCIESIRNQTYSNIEIILINDGSTDNCGLICDEYSKIDDRIKVFHKENTGQASARNLGIRKANGEFLCFIDSDDYIDNEMIDELYKACIKNNVDISWCDKILEIENNKKSIACICDKECKMTKVEALRKVLLHDTSTCDKLYRKNIFEEVTFPEDRFFEDIIAIYKIIEKSDYVFHVGKPYYHYYQHSDSTVHKEFHINKMDYAYNAKEFYNHICNNYKELREEANAYYILVLTSVIGDLYKYRKNFKKQYEELLDEYKIALNGNLRNQYIPFVKKIMCLFIRLNMVGFVEFIKKVKDFIKYR